MKIPTKKWKARNRKASSTTMMVTKETVVVKLQINKKSKVEDGEEVTIMNFRITKKLIEDLGASPGCQACENTRAGVGTRGLVHSI